MPGKLYNKIYSHIILLLLAHACAGAASLPTSLRAAKCNDAENAIQTYLTSQYTYGFDKLQVLAFPWSSSTSIRNAMQTMGESNSQPPLKYRRRVIANRAPPRIPIALTPPSEPMLVSVASPSSQAPVNSVSTSEVATSEQLSSLEIPQATPPPVAAVTLTTSKKNAASPDNLLGNTPSIPAAEPDQRTALDSADNSNNVTPVGSSQVFTVPLQSTTHPPGSSDGISDPTNLVLAPGKTQPAPNSRGSTSPALPAASEDGKSVGMPRTLKTSLSPTSAYASVVSSTDQTSMPPSMIPTTAPAILTALGSAHNAHPASQRIWYGRTLNSSVIARVSGGVSSAGFVGNGTSGQKSSTAASVTANVTAPSRPPIIVFSTSLFPVGTTATLPPTISSSSNAGGLQFRGDRSRFRGLELIRLLECLAVCMMVGARIFV